MKKDKFNEDYAVEKQYIYSLHEYRCHTGSAPTIREIIEDCGAQFCAEWICRVLDDLQEYTAAKTRLSPNQRRSLAYVIMSQYGRLKASEVLLWLVKAKAGQWGKFYNTIDPMDISTGLGAWFKECERIKAEAAYREAQAQSEREREAMRENSISIEEALRRGLLKNQRVVEWLTNKRRK